MKTVYSLEEFELDPPLSLTIGNFDGVHLGHRAILSKLTDKKVVLTFSNHPQEVLKNKPFYSLTTNMHRLKLLEEAGIDTTVMIPFTKAFSKQSAEDFLLKLHASIPFSSLVLGHDALIGHERRGDAATLKTLSIKRGFSLSYLPPITYDNVIISSSEVRKQVQQGCFIRASALLGRPYSILSKVEAGAQYGRLLGFKTANLPIHTLCLPPLGVYIIETNIKGKTYIGVANIGHAPTLHAKRPPILEVHLIDYQESLYEQEIEIVFLQFLRPEKRFDSIEALKTQIQLDVDSALSYREKTSE